MGQVHVEVAEGIATITLDNPARHNAVDAPMRAGLAAALERVENDDAIRVAIVRGAGESFCAGGSVDDYLAQGTFGPGAVPLPKIPRPWPARKPYIAAMRGHAYGGGFALALACDLRVAGRRARMGPTGLKLGAVQGAQTVTRLTRLVGESRAAGILLLSRAVGGEEAAAIGLVQAVTEDAAVDDHALGWARTIAGFSPWTVRETKRLIRAVQDLPFEQALAEEDRVNAESYARPDALEGFTAFTEKRRPRF